MEEHPVYADRVAGLRRRMSARGDVLYTSALTVGEIIVKPLSAGRPDLADRYLGFFSRPGINVLSFDLKAAALYGRIRQDRGVGRPDAVQLACAAAAGVHLFLTNDDRLSRKIVPGIDFITGLERAPV